MEKILVVQPHSDDAILSCSKFLFNPEEYETEVLTIEKNEKRLLEDERISEVIEIPYFNLGVEVKDDFYHDYFQEYGKNAEVEFDTVLQFYSDKLGNDVLEALIDTLNEKIEEYRAKGYTIVCPLGVGHPFHCLIRNFIADQTGFIYYKDFPHAYKRKAKSQYDAEISTMGDPIIYDNVEVSKLKYEIAQRFYKTQSGFFFYEHGRIMKNIPEEFFMKLEPKQEKHVKIYVISKGRPNGKTFRLLNIGKVEHTAVVEPQDAQSYVDAGHKNIMILPENDRGFSYVVNQVKNLYDGVNPIMIMDDDLNDFFYSIPGQAKCSLSMKTEQDFAEFFRKLDEEICNTDFEIGTLGKSAFDWNCEDVSPKTKHSGIPAVIIINSERLKKFDLDESLCFKGDIDYALKCMYLGIKYAKFVHFLYHAKMNKDGKQKGGLSEVYKNSENIIKAQSILLERWKENVVIDTKKKKNNGVDELRIIYKVKNTPPVIYELKKLLDYG